MENNNPFKNFAGLKLFIIGIITLILLIPVGMIAGLIMEREARHRDVRQEISQKWGDKQTITGPILTIPYHEHIEVKGNDNKKEWIKKTKYAHFLPESLVISATVNPEIRYRGIYEAVLYGSQSQVTARFSAPAFSVLNIPQKDILWEQAYIAVGISDLKGIKDNIILNWNKDQLPVNPGVNGNENLYRGVYAPVNVVAGIKNYDITFTLELNGSSALEFTPVGKETIVKMQAPWPHPSFSGDFLPDQRTITENGFSASWRVLYLNRDFPQHWTGKKSIQDTSPRFGVNLLLPVEQYQKTMRTVKYAIMFIALTFIAFFLMEITNKKHMHPIQYLLIGCALVIYYTLLLSVSEYLPFGWAYLLASFAVIGLISAYTKSVLSNPRLTGFIFGLLVVLYLFLYIILQLQDFALLFGSMALFIALAILMYATRKINWYAFNKETK